ncbi:MAG: hypothetical protein VYE73_09185 [Acidobacteriota bacterium]|nr:hypothetical protein [Acidobacteriota bacterium]
MAEWGKMGRWRHQAAAVGFVSVAFLVAACGGEPPRRDPAGQPGLLIGTVRLAGSELPTPTTIANTTDPEACGPEHSLEELVVDAATRGVSNVFAVLRRVAGDADGTAAAVDAPSPTTLLLDNVGCRFVPRAAIVPTGTQLETTNSDEVLHTVHFYGPVEFNLALPLRGVRVSRQLDRPGLYAVRCDVHGWMQALIRVVDDAYFAISNEAGRFEIESIAPGSYVLEVWHERLGTRTVDVEVGTRSAVEVSVDYDSENR